MNNRRGYTLIELMVAVGLFAIIMLLASGAYFVMISINQQVQGIASGMNNLSFALETMTRNIRTGTAYSCGGTAGMGIDCQNSPTFSFTDVTGFNVTYSTSQQLGSNGMVWDIVKNGMSLTDPSVNITSLQFFVVGSGKPPDDYQQARVTILITGTVSYKGKSQSFSIETGATMRGSDI